MSEIIEQKQCPYTDPSFTNIVINFEELIKSTQKELDNFKCEHTKLREEVKHISDDNKDCQLVNSSRENELITNEIISNLNSQVENLKQERETIHSLWRISQKTILSLEKELNYYRTQLNQPNCANILQDKYSKSIKLLENTVKCQRVELQRQVEFNADVLKKQNLNTKLIRLLKLQNFEKEKKIKDLLELESTNCHLKERLSIAMKTTNDLQKSLNLAKDVINDRFSKEKEALEKVQEALYIAESAIKAKEQSLLREKVMKEECEHLAATIGQVMDEAASKVETNIDKLMSDYNSKVKILQETQKNFERILENQKMKAQYAELRCKELEKNLKEVQCKNHTLEKDLHMATQAIVELEMTLETIQNLVKHDEYSCKLTDQQENELKTYLQNMQHIKKRWKGVVEDVTGKFENEINYLQKENTNLKAENQELRLLIGDQS